MIEREWNFENDRSSDFSISNAVSLIKPYYNNVSEAKLTFLHHGTFNVYEVDNYIFRIPDKTLYNIKGYEIIQKEIKKLHFLHNQFSFKIPNPVFVSDNPDYPLVGYEKVPGLALEKIWDKIPENMYSFIAKDIASFLNELHSKKILTTFLNDFNEKKLSDQDIKHSFETIFEKVKEKVYLIISEQSRLFLKDIFENFFSLFDKNTFIPCVTHQDFDVSNILVDPNSFRVTGIIDFEDMGIGDPAYDLVFIDQKKDFFKSLLINYTHIDATIEQRILFYYQRIAIPYFLYGIENNVQEMIDYGHYLLQKRLNNKDLKI